MGNLFTKQYNSFSFQNIGDPALLMQAVKDIRPTSIGGIGSHDVILKRMLDEVLEIEAAWIRYPGSDALEEIVYWQQGDKKIYELVDRFKKSALYGNPRAYLYISNEPTASANRQAEMVAWHVRACQIARSEGVRLVIGNFGVGNYSYTAVHTGLFDPLFAELKDGYHILGLHEYGGPFPMISTANKIDSDMLSIEKLQPLYWPSEWDVQSGLNGDFNGKRLGNNEGNWLVGRYAWYLRRADYKYPGNNMRVLITEAGPDRFTTYEASGIYQFWEQKFKHKEFHNGKWIDVIVPWPHITMRGWNTLRWVYEAVYPQWGFERTVFEIMNWYNRIYADELYLQWDRLPENRKRRVIGINFYVWSPDKDDWDIKYGFDISRLKALFSILKVHADEVYLKPVETLPDPLEDYSKGIPAKIVTSDFINWRKAGSLDEEILGRLYNGDLVHWHPDSVIVRAGYSWYQVDYQGERGWCAVVGERTAEQQFVKVAPPSISIGVSAQNYKPPFQVVLTAQLSGNVTAITWKVNGIVAGNEPVYILKVPSYSPMYEIALEVTGFGGTTIVTHTIVPENPEPSETVTLNREMLLGKLAVIAGSNKDIEDVIRMLLGVIE